MTIPSTVQTALALMITAAVLGSASAAEKSFGGQDAAYIDWAWTNCDLTGTRKERELVDKTNGKRDQFLREYDEQYKKITAATSTVDQVRKTCRDISEWYGEGGSRISSLVTQKKGGGQSVPLGPDMQRPAAAAEGTHIGKKGGY